MVTTSLVWLRNDLRMADNPALSAAVRAADTTIAVYIHETSDGVRPPGPAGRWWLHHSLVALGADLAGRGIRLVVRSGDARALIPRLVREFEAGAAFWNRRYAPGECATDTTIETRLKADGVTVHSCPGNVLIEPWDIATVQGRPYSVFTPFWNALRARQVALPLREPDGGEPLGEPRIDDEHRAPKWSGKLGRHWRIGEAAAAEALGDFLDIGLEHYPEGRNVPGQSATSRLSPHLRWGEISPRQVWHAAMAVAHADHRQQAAVDKFLSELAWRDFNYHQLYHRPDIATQPMQPKSADIAWRDDEHDLVAWHHGRTGLPIVDAGMRELWETGFMQNRVRMLTASLLTKNLLIDWRRGEQWFWNCLVDADVANNPANWQWVAGSGMDASPWFRIFNPVTQGERYDADGDYVRRWVPELAELPDAFIHRPFAAPSDTLHKAGVVIERDYPAPIVDLKASRVRALDAAKRL